MESVEATGAAVGTKNLAPTGGFTVDAAGELKWFVGAADVEPPLLNVSTYLCENNRFQVISPLCYILTINTVKRKKNEFHA